MEQTADSQPPKRTRIRWKNMAVVKTFLETCSFEVALNGKEGGSLKPLSWKKVSENLKEIHNFPVDKKQMRNHYDYLKGKYGAWLKLKNKTGNVYDPSTNSFNLTHEQWELEIRSNKYVESLRTTNLPFPELCTQLFEGGVSTGIGSFGPLSNDPEPSVEPFFVSNNDGVEISNSQPTSSTPVSSTPTQVRANKRKVSQFDIDEEILTVLKALAVKHGNNGDVEPPSYMLCLEKLNDLGWPKDSPMYRIAMALLGDKQNGVLIAHNIWLICLIKLQPV